MNFWIQVSHPRTTGKFDENDETLDEAIETVFPLYTEKVIMVWNGVYIPLGYKYDLSVMMEDILVMLEKLGKSSSGMHKVHWPSNTFSSIWNLQWEENHLEIDTKWFSLVGYTEALLLQRSVLKIDKNSFTQEWKRLLGNILLALEECGYRSVMLPGMKRLERQHNIISGEGILYR